MNRIMKLKDFYGLIWERQAAFAVTNIDCFEKFYLAGMTLEDYNLAISDVIFTLGAINKGYRLDAFITDVYTDATVKAFTITADDCILVAIDYE